MLNTLLLMTQK